MSSGKNHLKNFIGSPVKTMRIVNEKIGEDLEPAYFWLLSFLKDDQKAKDVLKIVDTYSASEASSFHRNMGQSLGAIQDRIVGTLRGIGELTRQIFRFAYELKVLEERLGLYEDSRKFHKNHPWDGSLKNLEPNPAEVTLKDRYINLVEGGTKNPSSVYGLGSQVGFILLPDLFLRLDVFSEEDVAKVKKNLERAGLNKKVIEVVTRKLSAYVHWRSATEKHLAHRWKFLLSYLKQHYNAIKLNIEWVKPYLMTAKRMQWNTSFKSTPDILAAIEQSVMQVELLGKMKQFEKSWAVINLDMYFRTFPETQYTPQVRGDVTRHTGRYEILFYARSMTDEQIMAHQLVQEIEDFEMIGDIEESLRAALSDFSGSVQNYLSCAEADFQSMTFQKYYETKSKEEEKQETKIIQKSPSIFEPVKDLGRGFYEMGDAMLAFKSWKREEGSVPAWKLKGAEKEAAKEAADSLFFIYKTFKDLHGMKQF